MGCEDVPPQERHLGFNNGFPICVDNEPPAFMNCPAHPIVVQKSPNGVLLPVNFTQPVAVDNSGSIARTDVKPEGFSLPLTTFEDMMVEYFAYDYDGNVAICQVNLTNSHISIIIIGKVFNHHVFECCKRKAETLWSHISSCYAARVINSHGLSEVNREKETMRFFLHHYG